MEVCIHTDILLCAFTNAALSSRATIVNALVDAGHNVLITGIGGGVALLAMQICIAKGATVYVTSGNPTKIEKAVKIGAKAGVNYKDSKSYQPPISWVGRIKRGSFTL